MRNAIPALAFVQELETSLAGNIGVGVEASNSTVSGDDMYHTNGGNTLVLPPMDPYGPATRYIDIFSRGVSGCNWTIAPWETYITASPSTGFTGGPNGTDTRVYLSVDWESAPPAPNQTVVNINVTSSCSWGNYAAPLLQVPINNTAVPTSFTKGFVESDGHISIESEHTTRNTSAGGVSYIIIPHYGRTLSGVTLYPVTALSQSAGTGPVLEYDLFTFSNITMDANITLYLSPSLNFLGNARPLRYAIAVDDETPQTIQFVANATDGNLPAGWDGAVSDAVWGLSSGNSTTTSHVMAPGQHTLKLWALEPGVVFQKIVVDLGGVRASYLGPPESFRVGGS